MEDSWKFLKRDVLEKSLQSGCLAEQNFLRTAEEISQSNSKTATELHQSYPKPASDHSQNYQRTSPELF
jgi:hypothetical protein